LPAEPAAGGAGRPAEGPRLVLASASPRRRELLAALGLEFEVMPSAVEERVELGGTVADLAGELALRKLREVAGRLSGRGPQRLLVLAADTLVTVDGRPLGKPADLAEARGMLERLAGRVHLVVTAVALGSVPEGGQVVESVVSRVAMRGYGSREIDAYLATGEPFDKAGAYAVQGLGGRLVERVEGCYTNVVGLPIGTTARLLVAAGLPRVGDVERVKAAARGRAQPALG
jgi:septum formation protein